MGTEKLSILGSTGSIGTRALSLTEPLGIAVTAISGYANETLLERQANRYHPKWVCAVDERAARSLKIKLAHTDMTVLSGEEGLLEVAAGDGADTLLNAVVGVAGLRPTLAAIEAKKTVALANKETLVAGGRIVTGAAAERGVRILPVDSEHSAIFQCLRGEGENPVRRIFLTASGGPFYGKTREALARVTPDEALRHPNWTMGSKITVDSATMMNKGLEIIEAMWLFGLSLEQIEVVIHRQSIVHSMVEFRDHSVIAQLGVPDMSIPIQYALTYPKREKTPAEPLSIEKMASLTFAPPDEETFLCLAAAKRAARAGGVAPAAANAANERAVELFLAGELPFLSIGEIVGRAVENCPAVDHYTAEDVFLADRQARADVDRYACKEREKRN